jgi:cytolysin (calcineurin-like family phosphatase)
MRKTKCLNSPLLLALGAVLLVLIGDERSPARAAERTVTFLSTSDCHYDAFENEDRNERDRATIQEMNVIATRMWPDELSGGEIERPRGVVVLGDCIDDGDRILDGKPQTKPQYEFFRADFGLDGTDGLMKYPVFEGWGNHDGPPAGKERFGFSFQGELKKRNAIRKQKGLIGNLSDNGLHYSWDWDDVHFVQLNIYPADRQREGVRYSPVWHDPQGSLSFLRKDLAEKVGQSGRPVVLMSHCGFDTDWWVPADWKDLYDAANNYNIVLYLYGHSGTGVRDWAPEGESKKWFCINDGQTENGFFVIQLVGDRLRAAQRSKANVKVTRNPDRTETRQWAGEWEWKWLVDKKIAAPAVAAR